jgi:hypothetical protein
MFVFQEPQGPCMTTTMLQAFLNNVRAAEDIPSALQQALQTDLA